MSKKIRRTARVDWAKLKAWFMSDHTRSLADVAEHFTVYPSTVRNRAGDEKWIDERHNRATHIANKATEKILEDQVDAAVRCNKETALVARKIRQKVVEFLRRENLSPSELNAVASAHDKAVIQERLALGMATSTTELTGKNGADLLPTSGVLVVPAAMSVDEWERSVSEYQKTLHKS